MNDNKRNIDEFFLEELGNATETPPASVWETLEKRLDDNKSRRPVFRWWFYLLVTALFVGGSIAAYYATRPVAASDNHTTKQSTIPVQPNVISSTTTKHTTDSIINQPGAPLKNNRKSLPTANINSQQHHKKTTRRTTVATTDNAISKDASGSGTQNTASKPDTIPASPTALKTVAGNTTKLPRQHQTKASNDNDVAAQSATNNAPVSNKSLPHHNKMSPTKLLSANTTTGANGTNKSYTHNSTSTNTQLPNKHRKTQNKPNDNSTPKISSLTHTSSDKTAAKKPGKELVSNSSVADKNTAQKSLQHKKKQITDEATKNEWAATASPNPTHKNVSITKDVKQNKTHIKNTPTASGMATVHKKNTPRAISKPTATTAETGKDKSTKDHKPTTKVKVTDLSKTTDTTTPSSVYQFKPAGMKKGQYTKVADAQKKAANKPDDKSFLSGLPSSLSDDYKATPDLLKEPNSTSSGGSSTGTPDNKGKKNRKPLNMLIGIKAGYEKGANSFTANKYIGTIFGEVKFTNRLSFLVQPSIKIAQTNQSYSNTTGNYYKIGVDSTYATLYNIRKDSVTGTLSYDYAYKQSYDSMIASIQAQRRFLELELPFLFKYKLDDHFSVMLGLNFTFGKLIALDNSLRTISGLTITDTLLNSKDSLAPAASSKFAHTGSTPFSSYTAPSSTTPSPIRFGYSLGLSYNFRERFLVDLLIQQNLSGYNSISDPELRKIFSQAYIRLSLGYTLFGAHRK